MSTNERAGYATHQTASGSLAGRRIAITGGTSGLGLALVEELSTLGAHVAFVARGRERIEQVRRTWPKTHGIARRRRPEGRDPSDCDSGRERPRGRGRPDQQRLQPWAGAAGVAGRHGLRGPRAGARHEPARTLSTDKGAPRLTRLLRARRPGRAWSSTSPATPPSTRTADGALTARAKQRCCT